MKAITNYISSINEDNQHPQLLNDAHSLKNGLVVKLDIMNLDGETFETLFHDMNIDWSLLSREDLMKIYDKLSDIGADDLASSFDEWLEMNDFQ